MKSSLTSNPDLDTYVPVCCTPLLRLSRIIFFQFFSALIFTYGVMISYIPDAAIKTGYIADPAYASLVMFLCFVLCGQLSGGQGNPIFTLALVLTSGSNVTLMNSLVYIVSQFAGALVGGAIAYGTVDNFGCPYPKDYSVLASTSTISAPGLAFGAEALGTFLFVILYLIIVSASTRMQSHFWSYILVPCAYYISQMLSRQFGALNPSTVLANQLFYQVKNPGTNYLEEYWVYLVGPIVGALSASTLFNFFLLPLHQKLTLRNNSVNSL